MAERDLAGMLSSILSNPDAMSMLSGLLSGSELDTSHEAAEAVEPEAVESGAFRNEGRRHHRRELLNAVRPYLSSQRCVSLDRMVRALELYEMLEQTELLKGKR